MPVSVHIADVGPAGAVSVLARPPRPRNIAGLRHCEIATAKPLGGERLPRLQPGRVVMIGYWDDDAAIDAFLASPAARPFADGWRARLRPLRAYGPWPGLDDDLPRGHDTPDHDGPTVVITLATTRMSQFPRFIKATRRAEAQAVAAPGLRWGTALAKPPYLATVTLWDSDDALSAYAYQGAEAAHPAAMREDRRRPFHHRMSFVRFAPYEIAGRLEGRNAVDGDRRA